MSAPTQAITPTCQPVFSGENNAAWLLGINGRWFNITGHAWRGWTQGYRDSFTHWHPDQPNAPACVPGENWKPVAPGMGEDTEWQPAPSTPPVGAETPETELRQYWEQALAAHPSESGRSQCAVEIAHTIFTLRRELQAARADTNKADLLARTYQQHYESLQAQLAAAKQEVERYQRHVREKIYVDCTPDDGLPARILSAHIDTTTTETFPPGLGEQMNQWQTERNAILRNALAQLSRPAIPVGISAERGLREVVEAALNQCAKQNIFMPSSCSNASSAAMTALKALASAPTAGGGGTTVIESPALTEEQRRDAMENPRVPIIPWKDYGNPRQG